ncbi:MAG: threonine/serine exporter family protein [Lachnospiraceae bacterium]
MDEEKLREDPALVMECALDMGETMLRCGAEILRVEDTITRICTTYGGGIVDVFTILSLIILSWKTDEGKNYTLTRRINPHATDLNKLEDLNALSRYICEKKPSCSEVSQKINAIMAPEERRVRKSKIAGYVLLASAFAIFFGGTLWDGLAAGIVAVLMYFWDYFFSAHNRNRVVYSLFMSVAAGILCSLAVVVGIGQNVDKVMIGSIMLSIPGINLMNSLRDMMCGDIITGILRLAEALMIAVAIAAGFGIAIMIFGGMLR